MSQNISAEIVAVGTEILLGEITDTNSVYIAQVLRDLGVNVFFMTSVGDNEERIAQALRIALGRADVVVTCGGLGPTIDDKTRQGVALATGRALVFHQALLDQIAERFASFKVKMSESNRQQAYLPDGATVIENPVGTAPSFIVEHEGRLLFSLPGVPREMKFLLNERVGPYLRQRYDLGIIKSKTLRTAGIGESILGELIGEDVQRASNPTVGLAAHMGQVDVRIAAKAKTQAEADTMIAETEAVLRERIGQHIYGVDKQALDEVVRAFIQTNQLRIAVSETGLPPTLAPRLQGVDVHARQHATLADLMQVLGVTTEDGTLKALAQQAAQHACEAAGAQAGIAIVTRAEVNESPDYAESTAIAIYTPHKTAARAFGFGGQSENLKTWVVTWSLSWLWGILKETV
jgi:nicotinamide-nucleotide amidase